MICRLRRLEPSFSSTNEKSLESRRVRTQPCTRIESIGAVLCKASLIGVGEIGLSIRLNQTFYVQHSPLNVQRSIRNRMTIPTELVATAAYGRLSRLCVLLKSNGPQGRGYRTSLAEASSPAAAAV